MRCRYIWKKNTCARARPNRPFPPPFLSLVLNPAVATGSRHSSAACVCAEHMLTLQASRPPIPSPGGERNAHMDTTVMCTICVPVPPSYSFFFVYRWARAKAISFLIKQKQTIKIRPRDAKTTTNAPQKVSNQHASGIIACAFVREREYEGTRCDNGIVSNGRAAERNGKKKRRRTFVNGSDNLNYSMYPSGRTLRYWSRLWRRPAAGSERE